MDIQVKEIAPDVLSFEAMVDNKVIGSALLKIDKNRGRLGKAYVDPDFRGQGIHKKLIEKRIEEGINRGAFVFSAYTDSDNDTSVSNLTDAGFEEMEPIEDNNRWFKKVYES